MDLTSPFDGLVEPNSLIHYADTISDRVVLQNLLNFVSVQIDEGWRIPQAYLLWRLKYFVELLNFLQSLPSHFHQNPNYLLFLGLAWSSRPNGSSNASLAYRTAINLAPDRSDLYYNLANHLQSIDPVEAANLYTVSLKIDQFQSHAWQNFGRLNQNFSNSYSSLRCFQYSLLLNPFNPDILCDLGLNLMHLKRFDSAERAFVHAISLDSNFSTSHINLGVLLLSLRRPEEASSILKRSLLIDPTSSLSLFNLGLCHLLMGRFLTGWEYYEERLKLDLVPPDSHPSQGPIVKSISDFPRANEAPLIVWSEQGFGDSIQFCRYLLLLDQLHVPYEFHCQLDLMRLMRLWLSPNAVIRRLVLFGNSDDTRKHCPLLSLPRLFQTDELSIPSTLPYLRVPTSEVPSHLYIPKPPGGLSVGLVWSTNPFNVSMHEKKSIPLAKLMYILLPLLDLDLITIHSLQVGSGHDEVLPWLDHPFITDWSPVITDFADTAYLVNQLDLVISVDTAVAHLAAALNRPTWILLPWDADFRWLRDRSDSPWYPNVVRLFRQADFAGWDGVVSALQTALNRLFLVDIPALASSNSH